MYKRQLQYIAPYAGCAMAEYFMYKGCLLYTSKADKITKEKDRGGKEKGR